MLLSEVCPVHWLNVSSLQVMLAGHAVTEPIAVQCSAHMCTGSAHMCTGSAHMCTVQCTHVYSAVHTPSRGLLVQ